MRQNEKLKTGDILHCHGKGWLSNVISWFTKSYITHSAVVVEVWGQVYVIDAQSNGVNPKPLEAWLKKYKYDIIVARPKVGPKDPRTFSIKAFMKVGLTGYDYKSLIIKQPWSIINKRWQINKDDHSKMICSEYVAWLYQIEKPYRITPAKLYDLTQKGNFFHFFYKYNLNI